MSKMKVIFDTDIGDDIDDAFALALLETFPEVEILGITTVYRNTVARAKQVMKFLDVMNIKRIPVFSGIGKPIKEPIHWFDKDNPDEFGIVNPPQYDSEYDKYDFEPIGAVEFMTEQINRFPGEITIVCVGPLTNMAKVLLRQSGIENRIKKVIIMGGSYQNIRPEWNILCDPEAAKIVFESGVKLFCVGLDVTLQCELEPDLLEQLYSKSDPRSKLLCTWYDKWKNYFNFHKSVLHDPLAVATLVSDVCTFQKETVVVDIEEHRGEIHKVEATSNESSNIWIANKVDAKKFFDLFQHHLLD